jgi:WD40 repeat protein
MLVGTENGDLLMVNTNTGKVLWKIKEEESINSVTFSPDGKSVLCTSAAKPFSLRDAYTGSVIQKYQGHFYGVHAASFVPDGRMIISSGGDQTVKAWDVTTGQLLMTYKGHNGNVKLTTISADGHVLASGGDDQKLIFWETKTGKQIMTMSGHSDHITGALFSPDMQYFYSGSGDATIRKWSIPTGTELGRMHGSRDGEWITTTPDGYYSKSVEGNNLVHYVIPGIYETYSYKQFEALFNKPEIVKNRFGGCLNCGKPAPKLSQPPQLELMEHRSIEKTTSQIYPISIKASSVYNIKSLQIFVNGKPAIKKPLNTKDIEISLDIRLFAGANRITVIAYDEYGFFSNPKYLDVFSENANLTKPNLYIIGIGISYYPKLSDKWQLEFAHTDAISLVKSMQKNRGKLYGEIQDNLITNEDATIEKVTRVLDAHSSIGENDIVIIHMAGHGVKDKSGTFYFLTSTVRNIDDPQDGGLNWTLLNTYLSRIKGRVILFLDACHSGSLVTETVVPNDRLAQEFFSGKRGGVMVFSASKGRQYSMESPDIGAGAGIFTFALIQGLSARSNHVDINNNGIVEFMELVDYVSSYVDEETNGNQTPWLSRKELFGDLPLAAVSN